MLTKIQRTHEKPSRRVAGGAGFYGKRDKPKFSEDDDVILGPTSWPRWYYAASKIIDEFLARAYYKGEGSVHRRSPAIQHDPSPDRPVPNGGTQVCPLRARRRGDPVYGDGTQRRSFTWVGDVITAMLALFEHSKACREAFNVGHQEDFNSMTWRSL